MKINKRSLLTLIFWSLLFNVFLLPARQLEISFPNPLHGNVDGYLESLPQDYNFSTKNYPLILFLHGMGESGSKGPLSILQRNGLPALIANGKFPETVTMNGESFSFIVISPQFINWPVPLDVDAILKYVESKYRIDKSRIYLTGLSMGGGATWDYAQKPEFGSKLAAITSIAGALAPNSIGGRNIASENLGVSAYANSGDPVVPAEYSNNWVRYINAYSPLKAAEITIFDSKGHGGWSKAYDPNFKQNGLNMYQWFLQFKKDQSNSTSTSILDLNNYKLSTLPPPSFFKTPIFKVSGSTSSGSDLISTKAPLNKSFTLVADQNRIIGIDNVKATLNPQPGDTLFIPAGDYQFIYLGNIQGSPTNPIVIINKGGLVRVGIHQTYIIGFQIYNSTNFKLLGNGAPKVEYGIEINGTMTNGGFADGLWINRGASDFEISHLNIHDVNHFIVAEQRCECNNPQWWRENYVMKNVSFHHITGNHAIFEGFYIGPTAFTTTGTCGVMNNNLIENLQVYDNITTNTGNAGIQVAMAWNGTNVIHHNFIQNYGQSNSIFQTTALEVGGGVKALVYDNYIDAGTGIGMQVLGGGVNLIYNNIIQTTGSDGIQIGQRILYQPLQAEIINNTIINAKIKSISVYDIPRPNRHLIYNNYMVNQGYPSNTLVPGVFATPQLADMQNNLYIASLANAGFVNASSHNFQLSPGSPAMDKGKDVSYLGVTTDYAGNPRPFNKVYDIGAYEYSGGGSPTLGTPIAIAGKPITITLPQNSTTLDGSNSTDKPGFTITNYSWSLIMGPKGFNWPGGSTAKVDLNNLIAGDYTFQLKVTDNSGVYSTSLASVTVNPPTSGPNQIFAVIAKVPSITLPTNSIILDGSSSYDIGGSITIYSWTLISGPNGFSFPTNTFAKFSLNNLIAGNYTFQLTVKDNNNLTSQKQVNVMVKPPTFIPPIAYAGLPQTIKLPNNTIVLNGSNSSAPFGGHIVSYDWSLISGPVGFAFPNNSNISVVVSSLIVGNYQFKLTVTDNFNNSGSATVNVTVNPATGINLQPIANAGNDLTIFLPNSSANLDGAGSTDPNGSIITYNWSLLSGPKGYIFTGSSSSQTTVDSLIVGKYIFQLKVTDNHNASSFAMVTIKVMDTTGSNSSLPTKPVVVINGNTTITLPLDSTVLDGSASTDLGGIITKYDWAYVSGPKYSAQGLNSSKLYLKNLVSGIYKFQLKVTDNHDSISSALVNINVLGSLKLPDQVNVFPNPSSGKFFIKLNYPETGNTIANVYTITGQRVLNFNFVKNQDNFLQLIDLSNLINGIYLLQINSINRTYTFQIIKK